MTKVFRCRTWAGIVLAIGAARVEAQLPGQTTQPQTAAAAQLPLSGRGAQNGSVMPTQAAVPGTTASVNTLDTSVQVQGSYAGSRSGQERPFSGKLSLREAMERGLAYNLGTVGLNQALRQSKGQARVVRASLLPNVNSSVTETVEQTNLRALGIRFSSPLPGFSIPSTVGPFNFFDVRARLTQTIANLTEVNNYRSAKELVRSTENLAEDARQMVALGVGGAYLQVVAAQARVRSQEAQLKTAKALFDQATQMRAAGVLSLTDLNRSEVQLLTERQRSVTLQNDLSKQKINLARLTGLPPSDNFEITDEVPYSAGPELKEEEALQEAYARRSDLKAAAAELRAARFTYKAAKAERLPSLSVNADYGAIGMNPAQSHGTFSVAGTVAIPIWQGGRTEGDVQQADAALAQREAELEDTRSRITAEVKTAFLDLRAAAQQVDVAQRNLEVSRQNLGLTRERFEAGITDNVEVIQAQQSVASAELDYIDSVFSHNVAKLGLARAEGTAAETFDRFLNVSK